MSTARDRREALRIGAAIVAKKLIARLTEGKVTKKRRPRRWWVKPWLEKRQTRGASATLLREWAEETPDDLHNHLRMSKDAFSWLLAEVTPRIERRDTWFRQATPARAKLEMSLRYLATGDNISTLSALYRIPKSSFSSFFPEVCQAIFDALKRFIQVCSQFYGRIRIYNGCVGLRTQGVSGLRAPQIQGGSSELS